MRRTNAAFLLSCALLVALQMWFGTVTVTYVITNQHPTETATMTELNFATTRGTVTFNNIALAPGQSYTTQQTWTLSERLSYVPKDPELNDLIPLQGIESGHPRIIAQAVAVTHGCTSGWEKIQAILTFVREHLTYDENSPAANKGALAALEHRSGVCEEYATLFAALARASGICVRVVQGFLLKSDATAGRHAWVEVHDGTRWRVIDVQGQLWHIRYVPIRYYDQRTEVTAAGGNLVVSYKIGR